MEAFLQQIVNGLTVGSSYAVVALGFGLIFSVMRVINLAHPETVMIGAFAAFLVLQAGITTLAVIVLAAMAAALVAGLLLERLVLRPTRGKGILAPFIATAGISIALENAGQRIFGLDPKPITSPIAGLQHIGPTVVSNNQILTVGLAIVMMAGLGYYVRRTRWGRATRAVAENHETAAALGININMVSRLTVGLSAVMGGAAGASIGLLLAQASPFMGQTFGLKSFVCMLVAGNRHPEGIMVVGLMMGIIEAFVTAYVSDTLRDVVTFGLLVLTLYFRPSGLFGSYEHA
jgi:branched-chain amino acid transport system permease protein